ncbi:MAG: hypothetical protein N2039_04015 [Gemmataceae bacterium]|nr:hypothetical protein [Gemmataceae bacterium]
MTPKDKATAPDDEAIDDFDVVEEEPAEVGTLTRSQETSGASRSSRRKSDQRPDSRKPGRKTPVINAADIGRWRVVLISVTIEMIGVVLQVIATALLIGMALLTAFNLGNPGRRAELPVFVVLAAVGAVRVVSRALLIAAPTRNNASTWAAAALLAGLAALAMDLLSIGSPIARYFGSQTLGVVAWILQMVCLKAIAESLRAREAAESFRENAFYLAAILTIEIFSVVALITLMFVKSSRSAGGSPLSTAFGCLGTALRITWISLILRVVVTYLLALHRLREKLRGRLAAAVADKEKEAEGQDDA